MDEQRTRRMRTGRRVGLVVLAGGLLLGSAVGVAAAAVGTEHDHVRSVAVGPAPIPEPAPMPSTGVGYGPLPEQLLDVHLPTGRPGPFPVMIYVHAGGWIAGSRAVIPDVLLRQVDRAGLALVSIDYRLVTTAPDGSFVNSFPVPDQDVDRAIRFVKANAAHWNLDPRRVVIAGASAGGHLAALAAAAPGAFVDPTLPAELASVSPRVSGLLDFVGVSDFATFGSAGGWSAGLMTAFLDCPVLEYERCDPATITAASVAPHLGPDAPPAFFAYGLQDDLVAPATQGVPLAIAWAHARDGRGGTLATDRDVQLQQTASGHNIEASALDMVAMEAWIDTVIDRPTRIAVRAAR